MSLANDVIMAGLSGAIPAAAATNNGKLYFETDTNKLYRSNGSTWVQVAAGVGEIPAGSGWKYPADGRLTLATGTPVTTADQAAKTTLYYTPYVGDQIALYDGASAWNIRTFTELSITNAGLDASKPYDVFCYDNSGTPTLELLVWTNATTRATALAYQNGILVKTGATTRRYLGTIYTDAASKFNDVASGGYALTYPAQRCVWNYYHRRLRPVYVVDANSHSYNVNAARSYDNDTNNRLNLVIGVAEDAVRVELEADVTPGVGPYVGVGIDVTNAAQADGPVLRFYTNESRSGSVSDLLLTDVVAGFHFLQLVENAASTTPATFATARLSAGIWG